MASFDDTIEALEELLAPARYALRPTGTRVVFSAPLFGTPIFAIPDVHLGDGGGGDIFYTGEPDKPRKLQAVLQAIHDYQAQHPMSSRAIQLGDWFDLWRVTGGDPRHMTYGAIQNASAYQTIFELDARIGLAHVIGNHDAGFLNALPDRRVTQPHLFRSGFWLGRNVYALHGHQSDLLPPAGSSFDEAAVALATTLGGFIPGVTTFEAYVDRLGVGAGIKRWFLDAILRVREDPGPGPRPPDGRPLPDGVRAGTFVQRDNAQQLATIVGKVMALPGSAGRAADLLLVGHSHTPGASWVRVGSRTLVIVDAGAWVYRQANLLVVAEDTVEVFDVVAA